MKISLYYVLYATYMKLIQLAYALCDMIYKYRKEIMKKLGFTLAETLITLGIIGVVSALTIPSLIAKHQEKTRIIKLKKIYSQLQNAFNLAVYENGPLETWGMKKTYNAIDNEHYTLDHSGRNLFMANISKHLKSAPANTTIFWKGNYSLDGRKFGEASSITGTAINQGEDKGVFITSDGYYLRTGWIENSAFLDFWVRLPNEKYLITGVTNFHFIVNSKGFIADGAKHNQFLANCNVKSKSIASDHNGRSCTAWALEYENMEYLRCNDLKFGTKTKCK